MSKVFVFDRDSGKATVRSKKPHILRSQEDLENLLRSIRDEFTIITPRFSDFSGKAMLGACERTKVAEKNSHDLGSLLALNVSQVPPMSLLNRIFSRVAFPEVVLPNEELLEALVAPNRAELIVGGRIQSDFGIMQLYRGDLKEIEVPLDWFQTTAIGVVPDFKNFSVSDYGHIVSLGPFEASADVILYEFDPEYRKARKERQREQDKSLGACLRRLRLQKGVRQTDFLPEVSEKEIGRIERGEIKNPHEGTLKAIAKRLKVKVEEIRDF